MEMDNSDGVDRFKQIREKLELIPESDEMVKMYYIFYKSDMCWLLKRFEMLEDQLEECHNMLGDMGEQYD